MGNLLISPKRFKVLEAVDRFGAVTISQIDEYLEDVSYQTIFRAKDHLLRLGFIHERFYGRKRLLAITDEGAKYIGHNLKGVSLTNNDMYHQLMCNQVLLSYLDDYSGKNMTFETERDIITRFQIEMSRLETNRNETVLHLRKRIPDLIITLNGHINALEIEISRKTNKRLQEKLRQYKMSDEYDTVFYICGNKSIHNAVHNVNERLNAGITLEMLNNVIDPGEV